MVSIESSRLLEEPTPLGKEEDANIGVDSGWNTYRRYERRGRTNSGRSRTSNESDTGSGKSDSSLSERSRGKRKNGSNSESDGSKSDDNTRASVKQSRSKLKDGISPVPLEVLSAKAKPNLNGLANVPKKEKIQINSHGDSSVKKILQFTEQLEKVMTSKAGSVSKKEIEKERIAKENSEMLANVISQRKNFKEALLKRRFQYVEVPGDNFCLFHAVAMGLNRPNEGMALLEQVIEHMATNADVYKTSVINEDLTSHLANLKESGWGGELEINAMSRMFELEFEIWVPDRMLGAATQSQYSEGKDRMALAHYPGFHYDYLRKLRMREDIPTTTTRTEASPVIRSSQKSQHGKRSVDETLNTGLEVAGSKSLGRSDSMTLEELLTIPNDDLMKAPAYVDDSSGKSSLLETGQGQIAINEPHPSGMLVDETNGIRNRGLPEGTVTDGVIPLLLDADTAQLTRNQQISPGDPSLDDSKNDEGSSLNVNQEFSGPK